jgi:hypothetical protein
MEAIDTAIHAKYQLLDVMWPKGSGCLEGIPRALVFFSILLTAATNLCCPQAVKVAEGAASASEGHPANV